MKFWQFSFLMSAIYLSKYTPSAWALVFSIAWLVMAVVAAWKRV